MQLNGALNPGNSGGPVVTPDGDLVGVAVRTVRGAGIGFAVPAARVRAVLHDVHFAPPAVAWPDGPPRSVRVQVGVVDAVGRLKGVTAHVAPAGDVWKAADDVSRLAGATAVTPTLSGGVVTAEFAPPASPHVWLQFTWTDAAGKAHREPAVRVATTRPVALWAESGLCGLAGPDGRPLPAVATVLGPTPEKQIDLNELHKTAAKRVGERLTVDVLSPGTEPKFGGGCSLPCFTRRKGMPPGLDFAVDRALANALPSDRFQDHFVAVRLTGTVRQPAPHKEGMLFVVEEAGLIGLDGRVVVTHRREQKHDDGVPKPTPLPESTPPPPLSAAPATVPKAVPGPPVAATPAPRPLPPNALPDEPSPMGTFDAQASTITNMENLEAKTGRVRLRFSVVLFKMSGARIRQPGRPDVAALQLHVLDPATRREIESLAFLGLSGQPHLHRLLRELPSGELPCCLEFQVMPSGWNQTERKASECVVQAVSFWENGQRVVLRDNWVHLIRMPVAPELPTTAQFPPAVVVPLREGQPHLLAPPNVPPTSPADGETATALLVGGGIVGGLAVTGLAVGVYVLVRAPKTGKRSARVPVARRDRSDRGRRDRRDRDRDDW